MFKTVTSVLRSFMKFEFEVFINNNFVKMLNYSIFLKNDFVI